MLASGYGLVEAPTIDTDGTLAVLRRARRRRVPARATARSKPSCPKRRGVGGIAIHADGGIVCSGRDIVHVRDDEHPHDVARRRRRRLERPLHRCRPGACTRARCASRCSIRRPKPYPASCGRSIPTAGPTVVFGDVIHANGVALAPDQQTIYLSDSRTQRIIVFDIATRRAGATSTCRPTDIPTGWRSTRAARSGSRSSSGGVGRFTPDGELDRRIDPPSAFVTSVCFDGRTLYVTTGGHRDDPELRGCVLSTTVDIAGAARGPAPGSSAWPGYAPPDPGGRTRGARRRGRAWRLRARPAGRRTLR